MKKTSLPVDVRRSKTPLLKLPFSEGEKRRPEMRLRFAGYCSLRKVRISVCFQSKGGVGLPVLAAREMERDPFLLLSPFSRGL